MRKFVFIFAALILTISLALPAQAFAQKKKKVDEEYVQKRTETFEDDLIEGNLLSPDATIIDEIKRTKEGSLIKIRENFIPELLKSAEDL